MVNTREQSASNYQENSAQVELVKQRYSSKVLSVILEYARQHCEAEIGGYIYQHNEEQLFEPMVNVAPAPEAKMEQESSQAILEQIFRYQLEDGLAFVHSHVKHKDSSFRPSPRDLEQVAVDVLDWIIVNTATGEFIFLGGQNGYCKSHGLIGAEVHFKL